MTRIGGDTRVLITGSAGFCGSHVVDHLLKNTDCQIIGLDSFRHRGDAERIEREMDPKRYRIFTCDLSTPISPIHREKIGPVDYILNIASASHVDTSIENPVGFVQNNVNLALSMLEYARQVKPKAFFQFSTDEVFGTAPDGVNHKEWEPALPSNPYAASKAAQEAIAISYWRTFGVPVVITNTMNLFASRQHPEKFIPRTVASIVSGKTVTIHGSEEYIGSRYYLHCRNAADALLYLMEKHEPYVYKDSIDVLQKPSRFNVAGEIELNNLELAKKIAAIVGKPLNYELVDFHRARPGHDRRYALDSTKIREYGWQQPKTFDQSLEDTVRWYLNNPAWLGVAA